MLGTHCFGIMLLTSTR